MEVKKHTILGILILVIGLFVSSCNTKKSEKTTVTPSRAIHEAAFMGDTKAIKQHIKAKSDLNQKDKYGSTPLNIAATFNRKEVAFLLIDAGADLNIKASDSSTVLHTSAFFCRTEIVKALIKAGADPTIRNIYGATPQEAVSGPFTADIKKIYDQMSKNLGPLGLKLDYNHLKKSRPIIFKLLEDYQNK